MVAKAQFTWGPKRAFFGEEKVAPIRGSPLPFERKFWGNYTP